MIQKTYNIILNILNFIKKIFINLTRILINIFNIIKSISIKILEILKKIFLIKNFIKIPDIIIYFSAMAMFSFSIISLEMIFFHQLLIVTNYLKATFIISIAMLGIASGSFISFYLSKINSKFIILISSICLFLSIILSYYNIINIGELKYPFYLILPFIFGSIIISSIFSKENSNFIYFTNLIGSALGVIFPIIFVSLIKSENTLILLLFIPVVFIFILTLSFKNLYLSILIKIPPVIVFIFLVFFLKNNLYIPQYIEKNDFENKIMPELIIPQKLDYYDYNSFFINYIWRNKDKTFINNLYTWNDKWEIYERKKKLTENEKEVCIKILKSYNYENEDIKFINRVYNENKNTGYYDLSGDEYDGKRAKYLLSEIGYIKTYDLYFDVKNNRMFKELEKIFAISRRLIFSEDNLIGRVDLVGKMENFQLNFASNGVILDNLDRFNGVLYDPRVPHMPHIKKPKIFIVGLSADGIVKSARRIKDARISGIEINPTVIKIMEKGQFAEFSDYPYRNINVHRGEGRSFLESTSEIYDMITLMNIHMEHSPICTLSPEYFHTIEGTKLLLNKISKDGYVVYEEIIMRDRSQYAFYKFIKTIMAAMKDMNINNPENHIIIFQWDFFEGGVFRTVAIKKNPFTDEELKNFKIFINNIIDFDQIQKEKILYFPGMTTKSIEEDIITGENKSNEMIYIPKRISAYNFTNDILKKIKDQDDLEFIIKQYIYGRDQRYYLRNIDEDVKKRIISIFYTINYSYKIDITPATDDKPFPFDVYKNKKEIKNLLYLIILLTSVLFIPILFLLLGKTEKYKYTQFFHIIFFAILGFGYMLVEIVLMQKFQRFIGSPTYSLIVTLGGLLLFSGIGSFVSRFFPKKVIILCLIFIPILLFIKLLYIDNIFVMFAKYSFNSKLIISVLLLLPLTFLMGIPFPHALEAIKKKTSNEYATLMFGVSGAFSTVAATSAIMISVCYGFSMTFLIGSISYLAGILLFMLITRKA